MKQSHKRVIEHLRAGGIIWKNSQSKRAYFYKHEEYHEFVSPRTLESLVEEGRLITEETGNEEYPDTHWYLSRAKIFEVDNSLDWNEVQQKWMSENSGKVVEGVFQEINGSPAFRPDGAPMVLFEDEYEIIKGEE